MTALFENIIFGPVRSRRLGLSLGVNLLPTTAKLCNFNCIYCECGYTVGGLKPKFNSREDVRRLLGEKLREMVAAGTPPDVITFAGNGEPTMHPEFEAIIDDTIRLRDEICPATRVSVLSNATMIGREEVRRALLRVDNNILKLDSAFDETVRKLDDPADANYSVRRVVENMKLFEGRLIIQTMFTRCVPAQGNYSGRGSNGDLDKPDGSVYVDNTTPEEVGAWLECVQEAMPQQVMIYTIDRDTPCKELEKISVAELERIAEKVRVLGIECSVAG